MSVITIHRDPWSLALYARLGDICEAIRAMLDGDSMPYVDYWMRRTGGDFDEGMWHSTCIEKMACDIRDNGYDAGRWRTSGRKYNCDSGEGPITLTIDGAGALWSKDGSHRIAILRALDRPIPAAVFRRAPVWQKLRAYFARDRYQPHGHPDLQHVRTIRRGAARIKAMLPYLAGCRRIAIAGACYGFEAATLRSAGYNGELNMIEASEQRFDLLKTWNAAAGLGKASQSDAGHVRYDECDAVIGLSVWHHCATDLQKWRAICRRLAACPLHAIEIPSNSSPTWHKRFRADCKGRPADVLIKTLVDTGQFSPPQTIYTDAAYESRALKLLTR